MLAKNYTDVRNHLSEVCDTVIDDSTAVIVKRKKNRDVVIISLDEYNNMIENQHINEPAMRDRLIESIEQEKKGKMKKFTPEELREKYNG